MEITMYIEIPVVIEVDITPGKPGKLYGPPENCYPPEPPEAEVTGFDEKKALKEIQSVLENYSEDELIEAADDERRNQHDYAMDHKYDCMKEDGRIRGC